MMDGIFGQRIMLRILSVGALGAFFIACGPQFSLGDAPPRSEEPSSLPIGRMDNGNSNTDAGHGPSGADDGGVSQTADAGSNETDPGGNEADGGSSTPPIDPACDQDGDGVLAETCGGEDCDDDNPSVHGLLDEFCDFIDNDCDEEINEELNCTVYAHSPTQLYRIDPFMGTYESMGSLPTTFYDFDTSPDGTLYGITPSKLYAFTEDTEEWEDKGSHNISSDGPANGFAIDSHNQGFVTAGSKLFYLDLDNGSSVEVGTIGYRSSGDCVMDKEDGFYMTASATGAVDDFIQINPFTGEGNIIGSTGQHDVYGLTAAWGFLFGFTNDGEILLIDQENGYGEVIHNLGISGFYGAASSPQR